MGLANRVVPKGQSRAAAEALALELASLPQTCLRSDRASAYDGLGKPTAEGLALEFRHGLATLASGESLAGASRFVAGAGRHGGKS
jgi:enoyl-CoA hydratase